MIRKAVLTVLRTNGNSNHINIYHSNAVEAVGAFLRVRDEDNKTTVFFPADKIDVATYTEG